MKRLLILLLTLFACTPQTPPSVPNTEPPSFPSVAVRASNGQGFCGGVWIANDRILTAAHCANDHMLAVYEKQQILGREVWRDDMFLDIAEYATDKTSSHYAKIGDVPSVDNKLTIVMADGGRIVTWVVGIDLTWKTAQLKWIAPRGASGSPAFHEDGSLACIITKQLPNKGSLCDLYQLR